jgi:hypothetical protein
MYWQRKKKNKREPVFIYFPDGADQFTVGVNQLKACFFV